MIRFSQDVCRNLDCALRRGWLDPHQQRTAKMMKSGEEGDFNIPMTPRLPASRRWRGYTRDSLPLRTNRCGCQDRDCDH